MATIKYGDYVIDTTKLPEVSVEALLRRGLSHYMGNEQASKVVAHFVDEEPTAEAKAKFKTECQAKAVVALAAGTIGTRVFGPRVSPVENIMRMLARRKVSDALKKNGLKAPKGDEAIEFANGQKLTMAELIERQLAKHGDALRKEADAEVKRRERELAKVGDVSELL